MRNKRVAILYNDCRDHGAMGRGESADTIAVLGVLDAVRGVEAACRTIGWEPVAIAAPEDPRSLLESVTRSRVACVFNLVEELRGDTRFEAAAAWLLEMSGVPYTGSPPNAITVGLDKPITRALLRERGVPVPGGRVLVTGEESLQGLAFPCIVKPTREDASHGISMSSVVHDEAAARARARYVIATYHQPALVEEYIEGREFNVAILGEGDAAEVLPLAEIDFSGLPADLPRIITYEGKWFPESIDCKGTPPVPAMPIDPAVEAEIRRVALAAYRAVGLRDYGRVDMRVCPVRGPFVIEVNPNPDISPDAGLARAAERYGINHAELIGRVIEAAAARGGDAPSAARAVRPRAYRGDTARNWSVHRGRDLGGARAHRRDPRPTR